MKQPGALRGWPPAAGIALGALAVAETVLRTGGSEVVLPLALLVSVCGTVPLAVVRGHPAAAGALITASAAPACALYRAPAFAGLAALVVVWSLLVRRRVLRARAEAAARNASREAAQSTLLEFTARGERARIARELHDVVAHHISMISVQAETARLAVPGMPPDGARRLLAIGDTARTALTEMRRLLGVLREDAGPDEGARRPQPGLRQLLDLIDETRDSCGVSARLILQGRVAPLDQGVELTAYRIVQEALTNVRRHAPGAAVDVEVEYAADALRLRVRDNGPGPPAGGHGAGGGHGLLGMRERAAAVGGALRTGSAPTGGFLVEATLPAAATADGATTEAAG
ncbi:sensor histidine kinase [Actinomadura xylanilytica]|uniref:sensor histidine kinase n=1 Tax=Actinomadura xylanilytica TaxID=887459 RepID=UPI00255AC425|nr:histidine kinase [Actinomadura xylanilytica]MDL4775528.1 histidine kinase [Actinomadura xylanilytica]